MKRGRTNIIKDPFGERTAKPQLPMKRSQQYIDPHVREGPSSFESHFSEFKHKSFYSSEEAATAASSTSSFMAFPQEEKA